MNDQHISIPDEAHCHPLVHHHHRHFSWTAIFVGALVGIGLGVLLNLFAAALGLTAFTYTSNGVALVAGGFIGLVIGVIVSMFLAGYATGYVATRHGCCPSHKIGILYGFTTWSIALILCAVITPPVAHYVSLYANTISQSTALMANTSSMDTLAIEAIPMPGTGSNQQAANDNPVISNNPNSNNDNNSATVPSSTMAWGAFIVFVLFALGAISTCIGACCAFCCKKHHLEEVHERPVV